MNREIFTKQILDCIIQLSPMEYNNSIDETLLEKLQQKTEGKCDSYGYIKPGSTKLLRRSIGEIQQGQFNGSCLYKLEYSVDICNPVEGMIVKCVVKNLNKMGLFCEMAEYDPSPLSLILAKQHHMDASKEQFDAIKISDVINVEIIGIKFNYNDNNISCIGKLSLDELTMEEKMELPDTNIEIDLASDGEGEVEVEGESDLDEEYDSNYDGSTEEDEEDVELEEGLTSEKQLQKEERDVLEDLQNTEIGSSEEEDIVEEDNMVDMEGVQDLESVDLVSHTGEGGNKTEVNLEEMSDLDELGEEFEGETLDLENLSRQDLTPVFNEEHFENPESAPGKEVFELEILSHPKYKTFSKPRKNSKKFLNYFIYTQLNNMMINFYKTHEVEPKKVFLNKNHKYYSQMKEYLNAMGKSLKVEDIEDTSYVL